MPNRTDADPTGVLTPLSVRLGRSSWNRFPEGLAVNDWVLGAAGNLERIASTAITYGFGKCAEIRAQLQWMRDWNAQHDSTVRFYGMDASGSFATPRPAVEALRLC